ncbi:MAG: hypothetical protein EB141_13125 [Verrucomicrobia bacterium]|nr:hypothetical protein [Verrucomicrobiota bacterium]NBU09009.1 hypothetical protein [Pseudomonadota bacterium]NDA67856.1 hypothetical protein [Verrucomicrobiota bacterium]NDB76562.1 hypothetical protein [Verrucomicrobiota bacterium]NDD37648.1 hypothetical protein [Verrucomicrobiota bacterium]
MNPKPAIFHQFTALVLAAQIVWLGWFIRSEAAHDHLHVQPVVKSSHAAKGKLTGAMAAHVITLTPRWLKLVPLPKDAAPHGPAGAHHHRSLGFDSLASGQWCGLFTPAALPVLDMPAAAGLVPHRLVTPLRTHWLLLPGRAPPACA